jgi:hypothetical protein
VTIYKDNGEVAEVHTPPDALRRIHELMHAQHSNNKKNRRAYAGIFDTVRQLTEDCYIHVNHWPWDYGLTPEPVLTECRTFIEKSVADVVEGCAKHEDKAATVWPLFAERIRAACVHVGLGSNVGAALLRVGLDGAEAEFAETVISKLCDGKRREAACAIQTAFFSESNMGMVEYVPRVKGKGKGVPVETLRDRPTFVSGAGRVIMTVEELEHTEPVPGAEVGFRVATCGARLYRPALRRLVLPSRCFIKRLPLEPGGTILIDASGSMGDWEQVVSWCESAPYATVAYYSGTDDEDNATGTLFVYARGGFRAAHVKHPAHRGNSVDGPAMDWLLQQDGPRIMVTDRVFCGAFDSDAQIMRLDVLERSGMIEVRDYKEDE